MVQCNIVILGLFMASLPEELENNIASYIKSGPNAIFDLQDVIKRTVLEAGKSYTIDLKALASQGGIYGHNPSLLIQTTKHQVMAFNSPLDDLEPARKIVANLTNNDLEKRIYAYIKNISADQLNVLSERVTSPIEVAIDIFCESVAIDDTVSPYHQSLLRGAIKKKDLLKKHGGAFDYKQVAELTGWSRGSISTYFKEKKLLGIKIGGKLKYPAVQFDDSGMVNGLKTVIRALLDQVDDFWSAFLFLVNNNDYLQSDKPLSPLDVVKRGDTEIVLSLIKRRFDQGGR